MSWGVPLVFRVERYHGRAVVQSWNRIDRDQRVFALPRASRVDSTRGMMSHEPKGLWMFKARLAVMFAVCLASGSAEAARCGGDFNSFVSSVSAEAASAGVSQSVISQALGGVQQDMGVLNFDRRQRGTFNKSFEQYVATRVGSGRINGGRAMLQRHAALLSRIEQQFGVPREILEIGRA